MFPLIEGRDNSFNIVVGIQYIFVELLMESKIWLPTPIIFGNFEILTAFAGFQLHKLLVRSKGWG